MPKKTKKEPSHFGPTLKKGLIALLLVTIGILIVLAFLGLAGQFGEIFDALLSKGIGLLRYILPFILLYIAIKSDPIDLTGDDEDDDDEKEERHPHAYLIGAILLTISLTALLHITFAQSDSYGAASSGAGGGYAGHFLTIFAIDFLGIIATTVIYVSILLASFLFIFNSSFFALFMPHKANNGPFAKIIRRFKSNDDEEEFVEEIEDDTEEQYNEFEEEKNTFFRRILNMTHKRRNDDDDFVDEEDEEEIENEDENEFEQESESETIEPTLDPPKPKQIYKLPPLTLLKGSKATAKAGDIKNNAEIINKTFANFGINVEMSDTQVGPTVTQYTMRPADGVKLTKITGLSNDLALALAAHPIRIEAPIPGKSLVGIEVPNQKTAIVTLLDLLSHEGFDSIKGTYHIALGKDVSGKPIYAHLPSMPHMLIAGATGSGKTVCVNTILLSLIFQHSPEELRLILVDPKRVELPLYNGIPHLLTPVITDTQKTVNALKWCIGEMERRFDLLAKCKKRDINSYNATMKKRNLELLPVIVFVIDELADLMVSAGNEVEGGIIRLAQMARAVGIHLILATQRPSVDVITGLLKANIPGRIAFSVASIIDSRTILDSAGAEKLVGKGDMLFQSASLSSPKRIQGVFVSEEEMKKVIDFIKHDDVPVYDDAVTQRKQTSIFSSGNNEEAEDELYDDAKELVISAGKASASYLQRRMKVGYARAARLLDMLEEAGIIGPSQGSKPREILITEKNNAIIDDDEESELSDEEFDEDDDEEYDSLR